MDADARGMADARGRYDATNVLYEAMNIRYM